MGTDIMPRPLLRGWSHAVAVLPAAIGAVVLVVLATGDVVKQVTLGMYGAALTLLFGVSALYHRGHWSPRAHAVWRRIDHADISVMIAATYTPIAASLLSGPVRAGLLVATWGAAGAGVLLAVTGVQRRHRTLVCLYIVSGWLAIAVLPALYTRTGPGGLTVLAAGGVLYSLGAVVYAVRRPSPWPRVFGYHEIFHLLVIAASALFFSFIAVAVVHAAA